MQAVVVSFVPFYSVSFVPFYSRQVKLEGPVE